MRIKQVLLLLVVLCFGCSFSFAQLPSGEFIIGGSGTDVGSSVVQTNDGGYAIAGHTSSYGKNSNNMYLIKLDSNAQLQWTRVISDTINGTDSYATSIVNTKNGGLAIVGYEGGLGRAGAFFVKLDYLGNLLWTKTYEGNYYWALPYSIIQTKDGGYAITGENVSEIETFSIFILKLDSIGNIQWSNNLSTARNENPEDYGYSIIQTYDNGYAIAGTFGTSIGNDIYIAKLDSTGQLQWGRVTKSGVQTGVRVVQTFDNNYVLLGNLVNSITMNLYKFNSAGNIIWSEMINGVYGNSLVQTNDHELAIAGSVYRIGGGASTYFAKADSAGHILSNRVIGGGYSYPYTYDLGGGSIIQTKDKGYAFTGNADSGIGIHGHVLFLKIDSGGGICSYDTISTTYLIADSLYNNDSAFTNAWTVTSRAVVTSGGTETSVCFPYVVGVEPVNKPLQKIDIFPNPNNGAFTLSLSNVPDSYRDEKCSVEIYNVLGEKVFTETLRSAQGDNLIDLKEQPDGIYFYRVITEDGNLIGDGKVVIAK